ncbi:MAG: hypothetical protein ACJ70X_08005, partial [Nitrososphaera sp.]
SILEDIEDNGLIEKAETTIGRRIVTMYRPTQNGIAFCRDILEPYEKVFPRRKDEIKKIDSNNNKSAIQEDKKKVNTGSVMLLLI